VKFPNARRTRQLDENRAGVGAANDVSSRAPAHPLPLLGMTAISRPLRRSTSGRRSPVTRRTRRGPSGASVRSLRMRQLPLSEPPPKPPEDESFGSTCYDNDECRTDNKHRVAVTWIGRAGADYP
jgi:hypothetical protein